MHRDNSTQMRRKSWGIRASLLMVALLGSVSTAWSDADDEKGHQIAAEVKVRDSGFGSGSADLTMTLSNAQGEQSVRRLRARILENPDGEKRLFLFDDPPDVRGTSMLAFTHRLHSDDLWMYLPAIKRVKRITSNNKAGPFMGSEFAYEDLGSQEVEKFTYRYLRDERRDEVDCFVIERRPVDPDSGYTRENLWVDKGEYRPRRVEYYDRKDALLKILTLQGFRLYDNKYWRADEMRMSNVQTGKETLLEWSHYQFGGQWNDLAFDPQRLAAYH